MKTYLVGGAVRDELLNLPVNEKDWVVVGATPKDLLTQGFKPVGKDFPVFLHPVTHEEYALARTERKTAPGYHGFVFHAAPDVSLEQDLGRRDLTINAMAKDEHGNLFDPFNGQSDLNKKILRHVSPAFIEDPVRLLRIARFAARFTEFTIAPETLRLMQQMVTDGEINALVAERVWQELDKALQEKMPQRFFVVLNQCDASTILFPEINQSAIEALTRATYLSADPQIRFASLLNWKIRAPSDYQQLAKLTTDYHLDYAAIHMNDPEKILLILQKTDAYRRPDRFKKWLTACEAITQKASPKLILEKSFSLTKSVRPDATALASISGSEIQQQIYYLRLAKLKKLSNIHKS